MHIYLYKVNLKTRYAKNDNHTDQRERQTNIKRPLDDLLSTAFELVNAEFNHIVPLFRSFG